MENKRTLGEINAECKKVEAAQKGALRKVYRCEVRIGELDEEERDAESGIGDRTSDKVNEERKKVIRALAQARHKLERCRERLIELEAEKKEAAVETAE